MTGKAESMGFMKATPKMLLLGLVVGFITVGCTTTTAWEYKTRTTSQRLGPFALSGYGLAGSWPAIRARRAGRTSSMNTSSSGRNIPIEAVIDGE